ncbi:MAG: catalase family protein [Gammaproteobacteria bacterium]
MKTSATLQSVLYCVLCVPLCLLIVSCSASLAFQPGEERAKGDERRITADIIAAIKAISLERSGGGAVKRFNQAKGLACLNADFHVPDTLSSKLQQGLFAQPGHYRAMFRFANASTDDDRDKDFRGMSIKVRGVGGKSLWGEDGAQDFLLNSHPALFAATPGEFLNFIEATADGKLWKFFLKPGNWDSLWIVFRGREKISSPLDISYWSTTPYRFGSDESVAVKYAAWPCSTVSSQTPDDPGPNYLSKAVADHLERAPACFDFMLQFQKDPKDMPVEDASVTWDESVSPFETVARITIENQVFSTEQARAECESMTFNPWQSLPEHRPIGGINRVRRAVYSEVATFRQGRNLAQ